MLVRESEAERPGHDHKIADSSLDCNMQKMCANTNDTTGLLMINKGDNHPTKRNIASKPISSQYWNSSTYQ